MFLILYILIKRTKTSISVGQFEKLFCNIPTITNNLIQGSKPAAFLSNKCIVFVQSHRNLAPLKTNLNVTLSRTTFFRQNGLGLPTSFDLVHDYCFRDEGFKMHPDRYRVEKTFKDQRCQGCLAQVCLPVRHL